MANKIKRETTRMPSEVHSRESKISALVANGLGNASIWAALEEEYPEIIENGDDRRNSKHKRYITGIPAFNRQERDRVSRALNSTRALTIKADQEVRNAVEMTGGHEVQVKSIADLEMQNRRRFSFGVPALDYIFGQTKFVHLSDAPDSKYRKEVRSMPELDYTKGITIYVEKKIEVWCKGSWRKGDPLIPFENGNGFIQTRDKNGDLYISEKDMSRRIIEHGCPEAFMSLWAGEYGVGKSRLAISAGKGINSTTNSPILYINGEANEEDMASWLQGIGVDPLLFRLVTADLLPVERIAEFAYQIRPKAIVIDSINMIAEFSKGDRGMRTALSRLKDLKNDKRAGLPHIILISQLTKDGKVKGSNMLPHICDAVASVKRIESRNGTFKFEIPRKNRGGETPRGAMFRHTEMTVECISTELATTPIFKLIQPTLNPAIERGVQEPPSKPPVTVATPLVSENRMNEDGIEID